MMKHLQRAGEVIALYRRCLEVARLFPDPCGRNYLHYYVVEKFRKRSTETSPTIIGRHIKQGRNAVRRLRRSLHSRRDYQHVIELAYGRKGPFKHLLREAEIEASQPPKLARPPRFMLEPLPGASGETFTLASLERFLDPSTREATGAAAAEREATEASARLQLAVLRELVPTETRSSGGRAAAVPLTAAALAEYGAGTPLVGIAATWSSPRPMEARAEREYRIRLPRLQDGGTVQPGRRSGRDNGLGARAPRPCQ